MVGSQDRGTHASNNPFEQRSRSSARTVRSPALDVYDVGELKKLRTATRRRMTATCNQVSRAVLGRGSRGGILALIDTAEKALDLAEKIENQLADEPDADRQSDNHAHYVELVGKVVEEANFYIAERADEPASVAGHDNAGPTAHVDLLNDDLPNNDYMETPRGDGVPTNSYGRLQDDVDVEEVERLLRDNDFGADNHRGPSPASQTARWCHQQRRLHFHPSASRPPIHEPEPDSWIDLYHAGQLPPAIGSDRGRSSCKTDLEPFSGKSLEWFGWIELFRALVHDTGKAHGEKLAILRKNLRGDGLDLVYGLGGGEDAYAEALLRLKETYGRRDVMRSAHLQALDKLHAGGQDASAFKRFAEKVRSHLYDLSRIGETATLHIIEQVCQKLQRDDMLAWKERRPLGLDTRSLNDFGTWLCRRAAAYQNANAIASEQHQPPPFRQHQPPHFRQRDRHARSNKTTTQPPADRKEPETRPTGPFCYKCEQGHRLEDCSQFKELTAKDRATFCLRHGLCFACLGARHMTRECQRKQPCRFPNCKSYHHRLLHDGRPPEPRTAQPEPRTAPPESRAAPPVQDASVARTYNNSAQQEETSNPHSNSTHQETCKVALGVVQLEAVGPDGASARVNVMFDEGSDTTLVREGMAQQLKLMGREHALSVDGVGGARVRYASRRVSLQLRDANGELIPIEGSTLPSVTKPVPVTEWDQIKGRWAHLATLPLEKSGGRIDILLGLDQAHLMTALETRTGRDDEPIASRTRLGWMVRGVLTSKSESIRARMHAVFSSTEDDSLAGAIHRFCDSEDFGTEFKDGCLSADDRRAINLLEEGTRLLDVGYEVPITWKEGEPDLPNNRLLAERRFSSLLRRFELDKKFETDYRTAMEKNFTQEYAVVLGQDAGETPDEYFLAHHGVYKGPKLRVVFDAAAKFRGKSLNDGILSGPAIQTPLPAVLTRFREGQVAWAADVEAMFSRVRLRPDDARYFRFLWKRKGEERTQVCEMRRLPFGATCSPFIAISVMRRTATDFGADPVVKEALDKKFYVDDYLGSAKTPQLGAVEASGVKDTLKRGDLHLQGWISNSPELLTAVGVAAKPSTSPVGLALDSGDAEKVLGVMWNPVDDSIGFKVTNTATVIYTHVGLLSKVASVFDPLGLAAPLTVKAKIRLRLLQIKGFGLHDPVVGEDKTWWEQWFQALEELANIQFPRCLFPCEDDIARTELHVFGDASEEAYAAVAYLRHVYRDDRVSLHLVKASTKIGPKKAISVPKMELNASLLAARLARSVQQILTRKPHRRFLWTDSSTVRNWIRAPASSYQVFVANRVGEIQTLTDAEEWRFVPGKNNPADAATRSAFGEEVIPPQWLSGPEFLLQSEESWPRDLPWMAVTNELRPVRVNHATTEDLPETDWEKVEFNRADLPALARMDAPVYELVRQCQAVVYQEDIRRLQKNRRLRPSSSLLSLTPFLGKDGLVRLGHRGKKAKLPTDRLDPPILPGNHPLARKIIVALHQELKHVGTDFLLSHLQQYIWVTGGREAVKKARRECLICRRDRAKPGAQRMGDLPESRLLFGAKPFTATACDLFGPINIGLPRNRTAKRWGVLFTCLVTRALYVDLVPSLSSDDFLLALRRFIGIYGRPTRMHSDNGTNFVGAERELREAVDQLHASPELPLFFKDRGINWTFQPAGTPHFGGAHESLVRSTKRAMYRALEEEGKTLRHPTDDMLRTVLFEVAGLLNSRPLTYVSSDPEDFRPLTPNDFLNRPQPADVPAGSFDDALPREHYRYVQRVVNLFWDQWKTTYLQSLATRKKWQAEERNFAVGDVVLELDKSLPRGQWNIGHITKVFPGEDGLVRVVDVQLPTGVYRRGVHRVSLLEPVSADPASAPPSSASGEDVPATAI